MDKMISIAEAAKTLGVTTRTLKRWDTERSLKVYRTLGNHRRYRLSDIEKLMRLDVKDDDVKKAFIYVRVSTKKQAENGNMERQKQRLKEYCQNKKYNIAHIYEEVASVLNDSRRELKRMLQHINDVDTIVVEYEDRLARFGYEYLVEFAKNCGVTIETVNQKENLEPNEEMVQDLASIVTCFSAKLYGERGGRKVKKVLKELEKERQVLTNENNLKSCSH